MNVIIEVDKGKNKGTQYEIGVRCYRAVGRSTGTREVTLDYTIQGDHALDPDDATRVEQHLARRPASGVHDPNDRPRLGAFKRGRDILLDDEKVSRTHAMIFMDEDGPSIVDLLSRNGTHVNGRKVGDADLRDGDIINIGKTRFVVRIA